MKFYQQVLNASHKEIQRSLQRGVEPLDLLYATEAACRRGDVAIVQLLEAKGALFMPHVMIHACRAGHLDVLRYLHENMHLPFQGESTYAKLMLHAACFADHTHIVDYLIRNGIDFREGDDWCFFMMCTKGYVEIVKLLNELGVDLDISEGLGLQLAIVNGHIDILHYAKSQGINLHARRDEFMDLAVQGGHPHMIHYLYRQGLRVNLGHLAAAKAEAHAHAVVEMLYLCQSRHHR